MSNHVYIRAHVTREESQRLKLAIERGHRSRPWLAGQIIRQWLDNPARTIAADQASGGAGGELAELSPAQRETVLRRERTLKRWQDAITKGVRRGFKADEVTAVFVASLSPRYRVGRGTLYIWQRRYQGRGLVGLIDRRYVQRLDDSRGTGGRSKRTA